jgi:hypothetical protein
MDRKAYKPLVAMASGVSGHSDCPTDDRCNSEQMRGTYEPPFQGGEEVRKKDK